MADKSTSGKKAILFNATRGTLVEGNGVAALSDNAWYQIAKKAAAGTQLPFRVTDIFKTPDSGNAITPIADDNVYPLTLAKVCKVDTEVSTEKGTIDVTDDCEEGYNAYITDGYSDISGTINGYKKFNEETGDLNAGQEAFLNRFFDVGEDDGAGVYTLTQKNDDDLYLMILMNQDYDAEGNIQVWLIVPVILSGTATNYPLKGVQNLDLTWQKAQGNALIYKRTTNSEETVF